MQENATYLEKYSEQRDSLAVSRNQPRRCAWSLLLNSNAAISNSPACNEKN